MRRSVRWLPLAAAALVLLVPAIAGADDGGFSEARERGLGWTFLVAFGSGFATSLTPCVYPMIPITLAIFGARGGEVSKLRAIALATAYIGGMGLTYMLLGVAFALLGEAGGFGSQLSNPWIVFPLVALFVAFAVSMFGAFDLNLPASWQARLNQIGGKGFRGAFAMGSVGGLIAAPCTGPFLGGLLAYVSTTNSVVVGGALLFVYALGMGVLFWVLAALARGLPKSGRWMEYVKSAAGIGMLFAAIYYLKPFIPALRHVASPAVAFLWVSIAIGVVGLISGALHLSFHGAWGERVRKAIGVLLVLTAAVGIWTWKLTPKQHLPWVTDEALAFQRARAEHKGVMVDFGAEWCAPCDEMELTFGDDDVYAAITSSFVPLKFDVTDGTAADLAVRKRYGAPTLPAIVFLATDGTVLARVSKLTEPDDFLGIVTPAAKKSRAIAKR